ncbi:MAG: hypothetical protein IPM35_38680 [Myxococcales bacterium]|nr:hypothetical protein [Myxococcales bacterium]
MACAADQECCPSLLGAPTCQGGKCCAKTNSLCLKATDCCSGACQLGDGAGFGYCT